ncbi:hypothetical protein Ancab_025577, partial [Ancistrocladus abbreviatus]
MSFHAVQSVHHLPQVKDLSERMEGNSEETQAIALTGLDSFSIYEFRRIIDICRDAGSCSCLPGAVPERWENCMKGRANHQIQPDFNPWTEYKL